MQNWLKITITANINEAPRISEIFELMGALSVTVTSADNAIYFDEDPGNAIGHLEDLETVAAAVYRQIWENTDHMRLYFHIFPI